MHSHIYFSSKKIKGIKDYKLEHNISQKEIKINKSFSYSNNIIDKINKDKLVLYIKPTIELYNYSYNKKKNKRKNFLLKSEIFNQNQNIKKENIFLHLIRT